ncbi:MAG: hypothetical protein KKE11_04640, partial [Gammaproteobacteria bacterium]|nr:hypothetical protein [Gammaproteobacteria bacterium]
TDPLLRETALRACINGESIRALKEIIATNKIEVRNNATSSLVKRRGQLSRHVELGRTSEIGPVKKIIEIIMSQPDYLKYANQFDNVNWSEHKQVSLIFQKLLSILKEDLKSYG